MTLTEIQHDTIRVYGVIADLQIRIAKLNNELGGCSCLPLDSSRGGPSPLTAPAVPPLEE